MQLNYILKSVRLHDNKDKVCFQTLYGHRVLRLGAHIQYDMTIDLVNAVLKRTRFLF